MIKMERFFAKPTPSKIAEYIYNQVIYTHETGGKSYRYKVPDSMPISFINDVIAILCHTLHDADIVDLFCGYIVIEWC